MQITAVARFVQNKSDCNKLKWNVQFSNLQSTARGPNLAPFTIALALFTIAKQM